MKRAGSPPLRFVLLEDDPNDAELIELDARAKTVSTSSGCTSRRKRDFRAALPAHPGSRSGRLHAAGFRRARGAEDRARRAPGYAVHFRLRIPRRRTRDRSAEERRNRLRTEGSSATFADRRATRADRGAASAANDAGAGARSKSSASARGVDGQSSGDDLRGRHRATASRWSIAALLAHAAQETRRRAGADDCPSYGRRRTSSTWRRRPPRRCEQDAR